MLEQRRKEGWCWSEVRRKEVDDERWSVVEDEEVGSEVRQALKEKNSSSLKREKEKWENEKWGADIKERKKGGLSRMRGGLKLYRWKVRNWFFRWNCNRTPEIHIELINLEFGITII